MQSDLFRAMVTICDSAAPPSARLEAQFNAITAMCRPDPPGSLVLPESLSDAEADVILDAILD